MKDGQCAWLIEIDINNVPHYFGLAGENYVSWDINVNSALKFADRESAEQFAVAHKSGMLRDGYRICEHQWG